MQKKEIKERFEEAIHALEVKQQNLIDQLDTITTQHGTSLAPIYSLFLLFFFVHSSISF